MILQEEDTSIEATKVSGAYCSHPGQSLSMSPQCYNYFEYYYSFTVTWIIYIAMLKIQGQNI